MSAGQDYNTTIIYQTETSETSTILTSATLGVSGLMAVTFVLNYLRKTGALNFLRAVGIHIPGVTTTTPSQGPPTAEEKLAEQQAANTALGKAATLITNMKDQKEEILKVVDSLPLPEQLKYAAHNPRTLLSKPAQAKLQALEEDIEQALPANPVVIPKKALDASLMHPDALKMLQEYANALGVKLPAVSAALAQQKQEEAEAEETQPEEAPVTQEVVPEQVEEEQAVEVAPAAAAAATATAVAVATKKARGRPANSSKTPTNAARKATLEVNEAELAEIKLILANKKKAFNVV